MARRVATMSLSSPFVRSCLVVAAAAVLGGCQYLPSFPTSTDRFLGVVTPYKVEVVQGNVITSEQAALVKPGMVFGADGFASMRSSRVRFLPRIKSS